MSANLSRWDPINPRVIIAAVHISFAVVLTLRPHLFELHSAWFGFLLVMPQNWWALATFATGSLVLFMPRASLALMVAQLMSATMLITISAVASATTGLNTGTSTYLVLALVSLLLFGRTGVQWLERHAWFQALSNRPPRWFRRWVRGPRRDA